MVELRRLWIFCDSVVLVTGQVGGELRHLARDEPAEPGDDGEGDAHQETDGEHARHLQAAEQKQRLGEHEAQQNGERERQQDFAAEIERADHDGRDQQAL